MARWLKHSLWLLAAAALGVVLWRAFQPTPVLVDVATIARGTLVVTVDDDGRTRVRERYTLSAPLDGRLLRPPLDAGDDVRAGQVLAELVPTAPPLLDARARAEAQARVEQARAALAEAQALEAGARADVEFAVADLGRRRELVAGGYEERQELDRAARDERRAAEDLRAAEFAVRVAEHELEAARAALWGEPDATAAANGGPAADEMPDADRADALPGVRTIALRSPVDGRVLRLHEESERFVTAGTPILEVGDASAIEVVADLLSQDAVEIRAGMEVLVEGWGGDLGDDAAPVLAGRVRLVEPGGFTKISALGVEEQRVDIVVDPVAPLDAWARLADGFRVDVRVVVWRGEDVLIVPTGALFREGDAWSVFVVEQDHARRRPIAIGHRNGLEAEVLDGLDAGARVVLYPSELVEEGARVEGRSR